MASGSIVLYMRHLLWIGCLLTLRSGCTLSLLPRLTLRSLLPKLAWTLLVTLTTAVATLVTALPPGTTATLAALGIITSEIRWLALAFAAFSVALIVTTAVVVILILLLFLLGKLLLQLLYKLTRQTVIFA